MRWHQGGFPPADIPDYHWPSLQSSVGDNAIAEPPPKVARVKGIGLDWAMDTLYSALGNLGRIQKPPTNPQPPAEVPDRATIHSELFEWRDVTGRSPMYGTPVVNTGHTVGGGSPKGGPDAFQYFQRLPPLSFQGPGLPIEWNWWIEQPEQVWAEKAIPDAGVQGSGLLYSADRSLGPGGPLMSANFPFEDDGREQPLFADLLHPEDD